MDAEQAASRVLALLDAHRGVLTAAVAEAAAAEGIAIYGLIVSVILIGKA